MLKIGYPADSSDTMLEGTLRNKRLTAKVQPGKLVFQSSMQIAISKIFKSKSRLQIGRETNVVLLQSLFCLLVKLDYSQDKVFIPISTHSS